MLPIDDIGIVNSHKNTKTPFSDLRYNIHGTISLFVKKI